ncbi:MAG: hypothetical protein QG600_660 [Patescibacteria group bacterium]|nr:hypothetical protein [Patescibacteria group bacterium]
MKEELPHERVTASRKKIIANNFLGGIAWAIGVTIGLSLFVALLTFLSDSIGLIPFIGSFISDIIDYVLSYNRNLR